MNSGYDIEITWEDLLQQQPNLSVLRRTAQGWYQTPNRWTLYEKIKSKMKKLIGDEAVAGMPNFMYTSHAYDVAHFAIFKDGQDLSEPEEQEDEE